MAKKTTRQRKEIAQQRAIQQAAANVATTMLADAPAALTPAAPSRVVRAADFTEEYTQIRADLRRIAILAIAITAVLIVISFVI